MADEDEWDTGAGEESFAQDKFNKFDASRVNEGVASLDLSAQQPVRSEPKPDVKPAHFTEHVVLQSAVAAAKEPSSASLPPVAAFTAKLSPEALRFFNDVSQKPFSQQACAFLNAYWAEVGSQAEFIFDVMYDKIKYADMHAKGVMYVHLYEEGSELDFNIALYFYEKLCKEVLEDNARWRADARFAASMPAMMTAIVRKQELRDKVDVNFDGKCSLLEILLYQYKDFANPEDFVVRSLAHGAEHPEVAKARLALEDVSAAIRAYETERQRLEQEAGAGGGVKALGAKAQLAILNASPLAERLNQALITAEAALRAASRKFGGAGGGAGGGSGGGGGGSTGSLWWMERDLQVKKARYGRA